MPISSPEDVINEALRAIGWRQAVGNIYEGSQQSRAALEVYSETRDETLAAQDWPFALREVALTATDQTPPSPWAQEFFYPSDCVRIRNVRPGPLTLGAPVLDPQRVLYQPYNDPRLVAPQRAILVDSTTSPVLLYIGRVTNPLAWEPTYTRAFISRLAKRLAASPLLASSPDMLKETAGDAQLAEVQGAMTNDRVPAPLPRADFGVTRNGG